MDAQRDAVTEFQFPGDEKTSPASREVSFYGLRRREFTGKGAERSWTVKDLSTCGGGGICTFLCPDVRSLSVTPLSHGVEEEEEESGFGLIQDTQLDV